MGAAVRVQPDLIGVDFAGMTPDRKLAPRKTGPQVGTVSDPVRGASLMKRVHRDRGVTLSDAHVDDQVAQVIVGLIRVRRALDPLTFDNLLGSVLAEIQIGLDVAEERSLEEFHTRPTGPNVVRFPGLRPERNSQA